MLEKQNNKKTEIDLEINLSIHQVSWIKKIFEEIATIEKEYNVNCTQIQINIKG